MEANVQTLQDFSNENSLGLELSKYDFANFFKVVNKGEKSYFNICTTINFDNIDKIPASHCSLYEVKAGDSWTIISNKLFGTIRLWWLLCKFNNITDPFSGLTPGISIKVPNDSIVDEILNLISKTNT